MVICACLVSFACAIPTPLGMFLYSLVICVVNVLGKLYMGYSQQVQTACYMQVASSLSPGPFPAFSMFHAEKWTVDSVLIKDVSL